MVQCVNSVVGRASQVERTQSLDIKLPRKVEHDEYSGNEQKHLGDGILDTD